MKTSFSGIFWGFVSIGIGCFFLAGTWGAYLEYQRVQEYSGQVIGQVTKKHSQTTADGSGNYYLDYWFVPANGRKINATGSISKQQWGALQIDDNLEIRFSTSNANGFAGSSIDASFVFGLVTFFVTDVVVIFFINPVNNFILTIYHHRLLHRHLHHYQNILLEI